MIECKTYRNYGHFEGDAQTYKSLEEKQKHLQELDAIVKFREYLLVNQLCSEQELAEIEQSVAKAIEKAVEFAENSPFPTEEDLLRDVYVSY